MRDKSKINIQEPPVTELKKKKSCARKSCTSGCGCIVFFIVGVLVLLNLLTGTGYKEYKEIPEITPSDIDIYESERFESVRVSDPPFKGAVASVLAVIPKTMLAGMYLSFGDESPDFIGRHYDAIELSGLSRFDQLKLLYQEPLGPEHQKIDITWKHLGAEPRFIQEYYVRALEEAGYAVSITANTPSRRQVFFEKDTVLGSVLIRDEHTDTKGTDTVMLSISIPLVD